MTLPGYPNPVKLNQSWWCGYGPFDAPSIVVCAVIENGGHGGTAAAPAALQVFEAYFHSSTAAHDDASRPTDGDRSRRPTRTRAADPAARRGLGARRLVAPARLGAARRDARGRRPTASGRSAGSRGTTRAAARPRRQVLYAAAGGVLLVVAILIDPALYRRFWRAIYVGLCGVMAFVLVFGAATRGSKRWIDIGFFTFQPSEFGKVLLALVARRASSPTTRKQVDVGSRCR